MTDKEHPILFTGELAALIATGAKTETRRPPTHSLAKRVRPGDNLWVREPHRVFYTAHCLVTHEIVYDDNCWKEAFWPDHAATPKHDVKRPAMHMVREASRLLLRVDSVETQKIGDMNDSDAVAEGFRNDDGKAMARFRAVWSDLYGSCRDDRDVVVFRFTKLRDFSRKGYKE